MTKRQFRLGLFVAICVLAFTSIVGYFSLEKAKVNADVAKDVVETKEVEKRKRTEERWKFLPNLRKSK